MVSLVKTFKRPLTYFHPPERKSVLRIFHNVWPRLAEIADAQGKRSWNFIPILHTLKTTNLNSSVFWASLLPVEIGKASWYHHGLWFCAQVSFLWLLWKMQPPQTHTQASLTLAINAMYVGTASANICHHVSRSVPHDLRAKSSYRVKDRERAFGQVRGSRTGNADPT